MSGLYNMLFGEHLNSDQLLKLLGITEDKIPRYRSCYWNNEYIVIHTRTGGGNREAYDSREECRLNYPEHFSEHSMLLYYNEDLRKLPGYVFDEDSDFDCTYANFYYTPPKEFIDFLSKLPPEISPEEQWRKFMEIINNDI